MGGLVLAFKRYNPFTGILASPWIGFDNFIRAFKSPAFIDSFFNTIILSLSMLAIGFPVPIFLAILLNEIRREKFKRFVQTVSYLPHFISWSVAGGMIYTLLSPNTGIVNLILRNMGHIGINFLGEAAYFRMVIIGSDIWKNAGWGSIIFLAAIAGVDEEMYEAALIDGANRIKMVFYITIPSIMNTIIVMFILRVGRLFDVSFEQIFILVNPTVLSVGETISYYIYRVGFVDPTNFGFGTAIGLFESVVGLILVYTTNKISKRLRDGEGGIW
jgi:putative aldouronate transport system permease protein